MNTTETTLLDAAAAHLRERRFAVAIKERHRGDKVDTHLRITKDKQHTDYAVEVKRHVTPQTLGAVVAQLKHRAAAGNQPPLLVTAHITAPMADQLAALNQQFVDAAGNIYLDAPGMFVLITGRKPEKQTVAERPGRAFGPVGIKTVFALLCNPALAAAPYRDIAAAAEVALGGLPSVLAGLQQAGHLHVLGNKRKLVATKRLLDEWALAYARTLRPKQLLRTLVGAAFETWRGWDLLRDHAKWGGEPAAALLTAYLKPGTLTIYAEQIPARLIVAHRLTTAQPNDARDLIEIRKPFWGAALHAAGRADVVPPVLVYADLLATGDARCIEAAHMIYEDCLAEFLPAT